jgi:predicted kinase
MKKAILTIGISASGKSTWAAEYCAENDDAIEINRDNIRKNLFIIRTGKPFTWSKWKWEWEPEVTLTQREMIERAAKNPQVKTIIISDTNLNLNRIKEMRKWLESLGFDVEYKIFRVDYEEAVKRDAKRNDSVGSLVIERQLEYFNELMKSFEELEETS